ncbi:protein of unknown function [Azospirillum baldaniorum]|uniref:Uncharacterized protein n=1 Tax=Azospirillum baldaniorum TaxID=1064539 RepID=A0A9P1JS46_9PROT|nr:protein of unknown function [Azospirillum baldaniorum]
MCPSCSSGVFVRSKRSTAARQHPHRPHPWDGARETRREPAIFLNLRRIATSIPKSPFPPPASAFHNHSNGQAPPVKHGDYANAPLEIGVPIVIYG